MSVAHQPSCSSVIQSSLTVGIPSRFRELESLASKSSSNISIVLCRAPRAEIAEEAFNTGVWPLQAQTARKLWETMATEGFVVMVIASHATDYTTTGRGNYLGYGVAVRPAEESETENVSDSSTEACLVHWISKDVKVPYSAASKLVNCLNNRYRIELTRDGFEIDSV
ncbi:hypothetical protein FOL47_006719 [Perkinsus chesapeaki]|uniref:YTH domain-containing protein n=1 Tax=Perkinsus chesapeaki TaxID=330153 RepID=A0A7J6MZ22_PERCH|nr:hypothetical protein FOL47_006719 [Perkinsus chesapeaki]